MKPTWRSLAESIPAIVRRRLDQPRVTWNDITALDEWIARASGTGRQRRGRWADLPRHRRR